MDCRQWREEFGPWLDSRRENDTRALPAGLSEHADSCAACAARREAARLLFEKGYGDAKPPADLVDRSMALIHSVELERRRSRYAGRKGAVARWILVPLAAAFAGVLGTVAVLRGFGAESPAELTVRFVLEAPNAESVSLVGDWNAWDPAAQPLRDPEGDGTWETEITLQRGGEYQYQFLIDDENWIPDPGATLEVDDGFGGTNSVLQI